jgi:Ulp1 family protease
VEQSAGASAAVKKQKLPRGEEVFLLDSGGSGETSVILSYGTSPSSTDLVEVTEADLRRLEPDQWLNDNCVDFMFRYMAATNGTVPRVSSFDGASGDLPTLEVAEGHFEGVVFFPALFFTKLTQTLGRPALDDAKPYLEDGFFGYSANWTTQQEEAHLVQLASYLGVRRFCQNVFLSKLAVVPVSGLLHWSGGAFLNMNLVENSYKLWRDGEQGGDGDLRPCLLLMDSLSPCHNALGVEPFLRSYLHCAYLDSLRGDSQGPDDDDDDDDGRTREDFAEEFFGAVPSVNQLAVVKAQAPQQPNTSDCGICLVMNAGELVRNFPSVTRQDVENGTVRVFSTDLYGSDETAAAREQWKAVVLHLVQQQAARATAEAEGGGGGGDDDDLDGHVGEDY